MNIIYIFQPLLRKIFLICFLFFFTSHHISFANASTSLLDYHFCENDGDGDGKKDKIEFIDNVMYINGKVASAEEIAAYEKEKLEAKQRKASGENSVVEEQAVMIVDGVLYINGEPADMNDSRVIKTGKDIGVKANIGNENSYTKKTTDNPSNSTHHHHHHHSHDTPPQPETTRVSYSPPTITKETATIDRSSPMNADVEKLLLTDVYNEDTPCHAHYDYNWSNTKIHAYKYDLTKMPQTVEFLLTHGLDDDFKMPVTGRVTSNFGPRGRRHHNGIDLKLNKGDNVYSAFAGKVRIAQYSRSYGYVVVVRHYNGLETLYAHLSKLTVKENQDVKSGEVIGLGGSTGHSTGNHLHLEVRYKGHPLNPNEMIDFANNSLKSHTFVVDRAYFSSSTPYQSSHGTGGSGSKYYTIRRGDTLSKIARRNGTSISRLCRLNGMSSRTTLRVGKRLKVK
ncbi:MAG: peptidoglycan DD-metalloendopeptidase family protein [Chitinophagales bacterium]